MPYRITVAGTILEGRDIKALLRRAVEARAGKRSRPPFASSGSSWSASASIPKSIESRGLDAQAETAPQMI